jgi:UDP-N-acetylglucosamine--N-acetylmuramyl-(pentapeptide) pyrophosphoryl-undecaprenol N-acetylglucosamine transferase
MSEPRTFVMAGGGTGGHVIPAIAVANELRSRGHEVHFIGTESGVEAKLVPQAGFALHKIVIGGLNRVGLRKMIASLRELPVSIWHSARVLRDVRANAVFSMGGYVAGPVLLAALWKRVPIVVMEPNAIPGFTHRKLARFVAKALVSFEETARWFPKSVTEVTGLPVRAEFFARPVSEEAEVMTVLITGGSQGSRTLNVASEQSWPLWKQARVSLRLVHQAGSRSYAEIRPRFEASGMNGELYEFIQDMPSAFAQADLVVSRAGAGACSELAAAGKPSILIPLPTAADGHQLRNAQAMQEAGAAKLVMDAEWTGERFVREVRALIEEPGRLQKMAEGARKLAKSGAAQRAADVMESIAS